MISILRVDADGKAEIYHTDAGFTDSQASTPDQ